MTVIDREVPSKYSWRYVNTTVSKFQSFCTIRAACKQDTQLLNKSDTFYLQRNYVNKNMVNEQLNTFIATIICHEHH